MAAARVWATGGAAGEGIDGDDLQELGIEPEELAKLQALYGDERNEAAGEYFGVFPENWDAVCVFCALETQWRELLTPPGRRVLTGLDYTAIAPVAKGLGVKRKRRPALFQDLRTMERAALQALEEARR